MNTSFGNRVRLFPGVLAVVLLLAGAATPARAEASGGAAAVPLLASSDDNSFSVKKFLSGLNRRERVVQVCVCVMCLALFILCKKFSEEPRRG
jgi:hypothetical protein